MYIEDEDHLYICCAVDSMLQMNGWVVFIYEDNKEHFCTSALSLVLAAQCPLRQIS